MAKKARKYKGDDLTKTAQDRKRGGAKYESWEKGRRKKKAGARRTKSR